MRPLFEVAVAGRASMNTPARTSGAEDDGEGDARSAKFMAIDYRRRSGASPSCRHAREPTTATRRRSSRAGASWWSWRSRSPPSRSACAWASGSSTARRRRSRCRPRSTTRGALPPLAARRAGARCRARRRRSTIRRVAPRRALAAAERTVYLDNRQMHGRPGFFVVTPFALDGGATRCWCSAAGRRATCGPRALLPTVPTPTGAVEVAAASPRHRRGCTSFDAAASGPIRQNLDLDAVRARDRARAAAAVGASQTRRASCRTTACARLAAARDRRAEALRLRLPVVCARARSIAVLYVWFQLIRPRQRRRVA